MKARKVKTKTIILVICLVMLCMVCCLGGDGCIPKVNPLDLAEKTSILEFCYYPEALGINGIKTNKDVHCEIKYQWDGKNTISVSEVNIYWRDVLFFVKAYGDFDSNCTRYGDTNDFIKHDVKLCLEGQDAKGTPEWGLAFQEAFIDSGNAAIEDGGDGAIVPLLLGISAVPVSKAVDTAKAYFADGVDATVYFDDGDKNCGAKNAEILVYFSIGENVWWFKCDCAYTY